MRRARVAPLLASLALIVSCTRPPRLPRVLGRVPAYALVDQYGRAFESSALAGKVHVVSFFFTSCVTVCPKILAAMRALQDRFTDRRLDVRLLSITVDAVTDTPARLLKKAEEVGADPARWTFLTGTEAQVRHVIVDGFKTYVGRKEIRAEDSVMEIGHGARLVLVDAHGRVRGHYETTADGLANLIRVAAALIEAGE